VNAFLGLVGLVVFSVCIIVLAAGMTWIVVKLSPTPDANRRRDSSS
jgi:hypothetical protein